MHLQLCDNQLVSFYLFKLSMANYQLMHEKKNNIVVILVEHSNVEIVCFWEVTRPIVQSLEVVGSPYWGCVACSEVQNAFTVPRQYQDTIINTVGTEHYQCESPGV